MSMTAAGKHRAGDRIAELEARVRELEAQLKTQAAERQATEESLTCELTQSVLRGMRDATVLCETQAENTALKARVKEYGDKVIRAGAEKERLRQAVINARPRITTAVQRLDRPYVSYVQIPYPVPVQPADTSNDETQQIPLLDLPQPVPAA